eukprot:Seg2053.12 transcript_id=Seg2053.12/GoldUCD/mRNA.D3Y31 product="hypothetical protein" protein_id=Seg2053.12/GoldUCD/D3Y31
MAKLCFENFKKRYLKKRNALKKANRSGTSSVAVEKAKNDLEPYKFFSWIDDFLKPRNTKSNVQEGDQESVASHVSTLEDPEEGIFDSDEDINDTERVVEHEDEVRHDERQTFEKDIEPPVKKRKQSKEQKGKSNPSKLSPIEEKQLRLMEEMERDILNDRRSQEGAKAKDAVDTFCDSLASELRQFSERERCIIKHEINNVILKFQMAKFQSQSSTPFSSPVQGFSGNIQSGGQSFQMDQGHGYMYQNQ